MKLLIAVPSKGRAERITNNTLSYLPALPYDWRVFVEPQDYNAYAGYIDPLNLVQLDADNKGLGFSKCTIARYAKEHGYSAVFKIDDDIPYWSPGYGSADENKLSTAETLQQGLEAILTEMNRTPSLKAVSFNYRQFMHLTDKTPVWFLNQRLQTAYICRTDSLYAREDVSTFEDFYTTLAIWVNGGATARYSRIGMYIAGGVGITAGGLQSFDRSVMAVREIQIMKRLYPPLKVRKVDKVWGIEPDLVDAARALRKVE